MRRANLELAVGIFVLLGLACLAYLAINLGKMEVYGRGYQIYANFDNVSGLKTGAMVEVAGVEVGRVDAIRLTSQYQARVSMKVQNGLKVHDDAIASIRTKGIIGDKFVKLKRLALFTGDDPAVQPQNDNARFLMAGNVEVHACPLPRASS